jgi:membrane protease YdiL (CAAX protease family)
VANDVISGAKPARPRLWTLAAVLAFAFGLEVAAFLVLYVALAPNGGVSFEPAAIEGALGDPRFLTADLNANALIMVATLAAAAWASRTPLRERLSLPSWRASPIDVALLVAAAAAGWHILSLPLAHVVDVAKSTATHIHHATATADDTPFVAILVATALAGGIEELLFRGYIQTRLALRVRPAFAIATSALLFGVAHGDVLQGANAALFGVWLGVYAWRTGNIAAGIYAHVLNNLFASLTARFPVRVLDAIGAPIEVVVGAVILASCVVALGIRLRRREAPAPVVTGVSPWSRPRTAALGCGGALVIVAAFVVPAGVAAMRMVHVDPEEASGASSSGKHYGRTHDEEACLTRAFELPPSPSLGVFLEQCLRVAAATPGFCEEVPAPAQLVAVTAWSSHACEERHLKQRLDCTLLFNFVAKYCASAAQRK